jgi:hypothetical protein
MTSVAGLDHKITGFYIDRQIISLDSEVNK